MTQLVLPALFLCALLSSQICTAEEATIQEYTMADPARFYRADLSEKRIRIEVEPAHFGTIRSFDDATIAVELLGMDLLLPKTGEQKMASLIGAPKGYIVLTLSFPKLDPKKKKVAKVEKVGLLTSQRQINPEKATPKYGEGDPSPRPVGRDPITWTEYRKKLKAGQADYSVILVRFKAADVIKNGPIEKRVDGSGAFLTFEDEEDPNLYLEVVDEAGANWIRSMVGKKAAQIDVYVLMRPAEEFPRIIGNWYQPSGTKHAVYSFR